MRDGLAACALRLSGRQQLVAVLLAILIGVAAAVF